MARIHSIITVTQGGMLYKDIVEIPRWIDFQQCYQNACTTPDNPAQGCVIARYSFVTAQLPYIEFFSQPMVRLEFDDVAHLQQLLDEMRRQARWLAVPVS